MASPKAQPAFALPPGHEAAARAQNTLVRRVRRQIANERSTDEGIQVNGAAHHQLGTAFHTWGRGAYSSESMVMQREPDARRPITRTGLDTRRERLQNRGAVPLYWQKRGPFF